MDGEAAVQSQAGSDGAAHHSPPSGCHHHDPADTEGEGVRLVRHAYIRDVVADVRQSSGRRLERPAALSPPASV